MIDNEINQPSLMVLRDAPLHRALASIRPELLPTVFLTAETRDGISIDLLASRSPRVVVKV